MIYTKGSFGKRGSMLYTRAKRNKYNAVKMRVDGILFDSKGEAFLYGELKLRLAAKEILDLKIHPKYSIEINGTHVCNVELDFEYFDKLDNQVHFLDYKGKDTDMSKLRRKMIEAQYDIKVEIVRGK